MSPSVRSHGPLAVLLALVAVFYASTLRPGHVWGDDFALYLHHAANLANGIPYSDTGYIFNPREPITGPQAYPPGLPLLLAPVYSIAGLNLTVFKLLLIVMSLVGFALLYYLLDGYLPPAWRLFLISVLAFNADAWDSKDQILSEPPFLMWTFLGLLLLRRAYAGSEQPRLLPTLGAAAVFAAASATRHTGAALALTPLVFISFRFLSDWRRKGGAAAWHRARTLLPFTGAVTAAGLGVWFAVSVWFSSSGTWAGIMFEFTPRRLVSNLRTVFAGGGILRQFWVAGFSDLFSKLVYALFLLALAYGLLRFLRSRAGAIEAFGLVYLLVLAFYTIMMTRLLLPVLPFMLAYAMMGFRDLCDRLPLLSRRLAIACGALLILATQAGAYTLKDWGPIREGISDPLFVDLCEHLRGVSAPSAPVVFRKPRLLSLLSERPAAVYTRTTDPVEGKQLIDRIHAEFVVRTSGRFGSDDEDTLYLAPLLARYPGCFEEVYRNPRFVLYRVKR